jgi:hypothetical protein
MEDKELYLPEFKIWRGGILWPVYPAKKPSGKETKHVDYALEMLKEQRDSASKQKAAEIVAAVKNLHVDEMSPGTKVSFVKRFSGQHEYTYLALKVQQKNDEQVWYVTGDDDVRTNEGFEELLASRLGFEDFQVLQAIPQALRAAWVGPKFDDEPTNPLPQRSSKLVETMEKGDELYDIANYESSGDSDQKL